MNSESVNTVPAGGANIVFLNRPKTFFYPIGWCTVVFTFCWLVWMVVS